MVQSNVRSRLRPGADVIPQLRFLTTEVVAQSLAAGQAWLVDGDVPDPINRRDLHAFPHLAAESLQRRGRTGTSVGVPHSFRGNKRGGGYRRYSYLDPYADLALRIAGRGIPACVERATSPQVKHARARVPSGGSWSWFVQPWRAANRQFRADQELHRADLRKSGGTIVSLDVADFYPSVTMGHIARTLRSCGVEDYQIETVAELLNSVQNLGYMPTGLPIGPELSAVLATAALIPVDRALIHEGIDSYLRWSDDLKLYLPARTGPETAIEVVRHTLHSAGLRLNDQKTTITEIDIDDTKDSVSMRDLDANVETDRSTDNLRALQAAIETEDEAAASFQLGCLRTNHDLRALGMIERHRWLTRQLPKQCYRYIRAVKADVTDHDRAWIAARAMDGDGVALEQLHLGHALAQVGALASDGEAIFNCSIRLDRRANAPAADALACAAARSGESFKVRAKRAGEYAIELSDLNARRAHLLAFRHGRLGRQSERMLDEIERREPDCAATVAWVRSA